MSMDWSMFPKEILLANAEVGIFRDLLTPEQQAGFDEQVKQYLDEGDEAARRELDMRREWAARIIEAFDSYHEHPAGGGECGSCGAIQAAKWMNPDYKQDGPGVETYEAWKERRG